MECYKKLIPVIITADEYLQMNSLTDEQVNQRVPTTTYRSINRPLCNYVSFEQTSTFVPFGQLSSLVDQPGISVIQFLTAQLYYKIQWKLTNNSGQNLYQRVRYLTLDAEKQIGPEPWDIKGNRICFQTPCSSQTTAGCFIVPGEYLYFVIEDPGKNLDIELTVTGYFPKLNNWAIYRTNSSDFCINGKYAYTNSVAPGTKIKRTLNPELLPFHVRILEEYYRNAGQPCFLPQSRLTTPGEKVTIQIEFKQDTDKSQGNCLLGACCGKSYIVLSIKSLSNTTYDWISLSKDVPSQFNLQGGKRYRMDNMSFSGTRGSTFVVCNRDIYSFAFYPIDSNKSPQPFIAFESNPPLLTPDANNTILIRLDPNILAAATAGRFIVFDTLESTSIYETRLNSTVWSELPPSNPTGNRYVYEPKSFTATFDLTIES